MGYSFTSLFILVSIHTPTLPWFVQTVQSDCSICGIYIYIYIILIARVRVQYGKIFYEHAKYFHEPKASENVA